MRPHQRVITGILVLAVAVLLFSPAWLTLKNWFWQLFAEPANQATLAARESRSWIDVIRSIRHLHGENSDLKAANLRLQAEVTDLKEVRHENELLRGELGFVSEAKNSFDFLPAQLVSRAPSTFLQFATLNKGTNAGVAVGQAVVSEGFFVGRIIETTATTAKVQFITASRSRIPITLADSRAVGLLLGGLAGLTGDDLPNDVEIKPGEAIVTSGIGEFVPAGLAVGSVETKLSSDSDFVQKIAIYSPIEFGRLEILLILKPK